MSQNKIICIFNGNHYNTLKFGKDARVNCHTIHYILKQKNVLKDNIDSYSFIDFSSSKILDTNVIFENFNNNIILINTKLRGGIGFGDIMKKVLGGILKVLDVILFEPIILAIGPIVKFIKFIPHAIIFTVKFLIWVIRFTIWFIVEIANPQIIINDFVGTIKMLTFSIINAMFILVSTLAKKFVNYFGFMVFNGFWGWDKVVMDEWDYKYSEYHNCKDKCKDMKCYRTRNNGEIPFSILLGTVICPPIGVFMEYGFTGWLNILVCIMLTFCFYFPGLIYALVVLYC